MFFLGLAAGCGTDPTTSNEYRTLLSDRDSLSSEVSALEVRVDDVVSAMDAAEVEAQSAQEALDEHEAQVEAIAEREDEVTALEAAVSDREDEVTALAETLDERETEIEQREAVANRQADSQARATEEPTAQAPSSVYYRNCDAARAAGAAPVRVGDPGYGTHLDRDRDGVGCE
ncbi:excalibur calcium-binding domain-containing protein [Ruania alba]|uniref:Excalibur calcium-binding domain-containing protein n=1 Tax=Ruania alba TaxID=648782 RepID=A0A1H5G894_9MICO|nr:excalibur calcium-binding domain-containing protein [Ruania alba]SEE11936.1 Excalibur calcium-binding domain-containing protein [Ruania alba]